MHIAIAHSYFSICLVLSAGKYKFFVCFRLVGLGGKTVISTMNFVTNVRNYKEEMLVQPNVNDTLSQ